MKKSVRVHYKDGMITRYEWNFDTFVMLTGKLDIILYAKVEDRPLFDQPITTVTLQEILMDNSTLRSKILEYAQTSTHSPRQIAQFLADEYTEDQVFDAIDQLQDESQVWFDVEEDILLPSWKPQTIKMAPASVLESIRLQKEEKQ